MADRNDLREGIDDADATGMVAGEELITQSETMRPLLAPPLPREHLHAALPHGHEAHTTIDELHAEVEKTSPDPATVHRHVGTLRALPELEAIVANWWDDPKTQRFIAILGQI
jgi:hypothetical protein